MNFSILNVALFGAGALLIASAIKGKSPQQLIAESVGSVKGGKAASPGEKLAAEEKPKANERDYAQNTTGIQPIAPGIVVTSP